MHLTTTVVAADDANNQKTGKTTRGMRGDGERLRKTERRSDSSCTLITYYLKTTNTQHTK
jgi:hypothetical protein